MEITNPLNNNNIMQIASHNTMTYLQPKHWWMKPFAFMARCQNKVLLSQFIDHDVRLFDFRVRFDKNGNAVFAHGLMEYDHSPISAVTTLAWAASESQEPTYVIISLEWTKKKGLERQQELFRKFLADVLSAVNNYGNYLAVCGGSRKLDWAPVPGIPALGHAPSYTQMVASTTWKIWDDWCPWVYAKLMNRKNLQKQYDTEYVSLDFVDIK